MFIKKTLNATILLIGLEFRIPGIPESSSGLLEFQDVLGIVERKNLLMLCKEALRCDEIKDKIRLR